MASLARSAFGICSGQVAPTVKYAIPITLCSYPLYAYLYRPLTLPSLTIISVHGMREWW